MKITTPAALACAGLLLSNPLFAQDAPAPSKPAAPAPQPAPAAKPAAPAPTPAAPAAPLTPAEPPKPKLDPAVVKLNSSYGFGYRAGRGFTSQTGRYGLSMEDLDRDTFLKGLFDALELKDPSIEQDDINAALTALSEIIKEREASLAVSNLAASKKYLEENKKRDGVITTETGLQYEILVKGEGEVQGAPAAGQRSTKQYMVVYDGKLIDGSEFDSSKGKEVPMTLSVIPGFKEALTSMPVGSKWRLHIHPDLGYKDQRRSAKLGPNAALIFDLELKSVKDLPPPPSNPGFPGAAPTGAPGRPRAVSPPVRVPPQGTAPRSKPSGTGARAVSPPVRIPVPPRAGTNKPSAVSPPVRIPTNPNQPGGATPKPAPRPAPAPAPAPPAPPAPEPK